MIENFWTWLLKGIINLVSSIILVLLPDPAGVDFISHIAQGVWVALELAYMAFGNFNLTIVIVSTAISLTAWLISLAVSIYIFVLKLIKMLPFL